MSDCVFVEYLSNVNNVVKQTFQSMQRIKLTCFYSSQNYLVFGATSGGIYIFKREPCEFLKLIPSKEGSAVLVAISQDEKNLGIASSKGLILILEDFVEDGNVQYQVYIEHEGRVVTHIKWHGTDLYAGDEAGKVSVVSLTSVLSKAIFQTPSATLMHLDSAIVQLDAYQNYLLVSTKTRSFLCDTENEHYKQIGKKLRDGYFGACFFNVATSLNQTNNITKNVRSVFTTVKDDELLKSGEHSNNVKIYCARPGARLWEVAFDALVLVTHQFKSSFTEKPSDIIQVDYNTEATLQKQTFSDTERVPDNFNFQKIFPVNDKFILTYSSNGVYIFDPSESKLLFWAHFPGSTILYVVVVNSLLYIWKTNLEINVYSIVHLEHLILSTLYRKQYYLCAEICVDYSTNVLKLLHESKNLYLVSALKTKIHKPELLEKLELIFSKIRDLNDKVLTRQSKDNIVIVENLYLTEESLPKCNLIQKVDKDENADIKLLLKQYKLNKTHKTVEIPDVINFLSKLGVTELYLLFKIFTEYVLKECNEDPLFWCQDQFLRQVSRINVEVKALDPAICDFLIDSVLKANENINFSCSCGFPLPKSHSYPPKFYKTALEIYRSQREFNKLIKKMPYLSKYRVKSESGLNMILLIQFSDTELFRQHTSDLTYDSWHDVLGYFVKLNKGLCLNCDKNISIDGILTWTDLGKIIIQSMGTKNTVKILEKYTKVIPKGALDRRFYQACIFAHSFDYSSSEVQIADPVKFLDGMDRVTYEKFQDSLEKYLDKKYKISNKTEHSYLFSRSDTGYICTLCNLPLKSDILCENKNGIQCGHRFHMLCFIRNNKVCNICN